MTTWSGVQSFTAAQTTAGIQSIVSAYETMLGRAFTRSSDTGQINPASLTYVASTTYGYSMWYLDDSLHATAPIYMRMQYATASGLLNLTISWGPGTDGAGNLSSTHVTTGTIGFGNITGPNIGTPSGTAYAAKGAGYAFWQMGNAVGGSTTGSWVPTVLVVREWDESTDSPESTQGNYMVMYPGSGYTTTTPTWVAVTRMPHAVQTSTTPVHVPWGLTSTSASPNSLDLFPVRGYYESGASRTRSGPVCLVPGAEAPFGVTFTGAVIPGFSHTWLPNANAVNNSGSNGLRLAVLWE